MTRKSQKIIHWTWIGFKRIKNVFRNGPFYWYPLAYQICFWRFWSQVKACKSNNFFPGHFDTAQVKSIKKFDILLNLSQGGRGYLFEFSQLSITPFWLNQNMEPPPHCLIFYQISNFFTSLCYSMSKWPEKIKIWFENSNKTSESSKRYQM